MKFGRTKKEERRRPLYRQADRKPVVQYYRGQSTAPKEQGARQTRQVEHRQPSRVVNHLKRLPVYISIAAIVGSLMYCSILGNKVTVVVPADSLYDKSYYETQAGEALNSSLFNHSKLTLDVRALKEDIQTRIPEVSDVTVSIPLVGRKPVIGVSLVPAQFLLTLPGSKSYVVGSHGRILADAHQLSPAKRQNLLLLQEDVPLNASVGQAILSGGDIAYINTVQSELNKANMKISHLQLPVGAGELHVHLSEVPYILKFAFNGDARQQVGAYLAVKKQLGSQLPTSYIDVRIGERVFIK